MTIIASLGVWVLLTVFTTVTAIRGAATDPEKHRAEHLEGVLARFARVASLQSLASVFAAGFLFAGFFASDLETSIWPWPLLAWVALALQRLWVRPHLAVYIEALKRDVDRPVARLLLIHMGFDVITLASLLGVLLFGLR